MPNWCMNVVTFKNENEAMLYRLVEAFNSGHTMEEFWPCPKELRDTRSGSFGAGTPEQAALQQRQQENQQKYGAPDWYEWCCSHWGVKWDFGKEHHSSEPAASVKEKNGVKYVNLTFDTAWSPPLGFYEYLHDNFGFQIKAYYFEPGMGFAGVSINGSEDPIHIEELTQEWLEDHMPAKLCRVFNLYAYAEDMQEIEQEYEQRKAETNES